MGVLDRWLKRFLSDDRSAEPAVDPKAPHVPPALGPMSPAPTAAAELTTLEVATTLARSPIAPMGFASTALTATNTEALNRALHRARGRLTMDERGRAWAEGPELEADVRQLDAGGRGRAADALLADALLITPSPKLRRWLAERLLHRGDRQRARPLLAKLSAHEEHATFAWLSLGEIAEAEGDVDEALAAYEQVLARDITLEQPKARARRLRAGRDERRTDDTRGLLARFLGARAAGSRYAVVDELGRGGAATVFRARDRVIGREVALKIFHRRGRASERRARILEEARIGGSFDHPHVVPILDLDESRDLLVMELCDGGSLRQRLQQGRVRASEAVELCAVLLRTLADIHDAGHVHLDVKPSNLLFHHGQLMLCDFGTAGMRELGPVGGTRAYMAPERRASGRTDRSADLYATGLVLAECLEGHLPSSQTTSSQATVLELTSLPRGPRRRALEAAIARLTARDPAQRPADGRVAAQGLLEAAALPLDDKEGQALFHHLQALAAREGDAAQARLAAHPLVAALRG